MMDSNTFDRFREIIYRESGIALAPEKSSLLANRIQKRLNELGLHDEKEYLRIIELDADEQELLRLINAISTNVTYFYREPQHFVTYREVLQRLYSAGRNTIKIWCAAASSGEEPYTLAFEAAEVLALQSVQIKLLATDISTKVLDTALHGIYPSSISSKIPPGILKKYMQEAPESEHELIVKPEIMRMVLFKRLNLVHFPYPLKGPFDVIFCRNVMIYFDVPTRAKIVAQFCRLLAPGGYLFLSSSENLLGIEHPLEKVGTSIFRRSN